MEQTTLRDYLQATEDALSAGRIEDALDNCRLILTHYPNALEAQRLLGEVYLAQGQLEQAQQAFDWVLTNDPENVVTYCSRALISERMQDYDTALDCYQQAYELSRGNSAIRQQFNQLSLKAGQAHFVFSRAGLARLYMRGDLLPQAIQEWEAVLTASPDRLDAQTGLIETYWREGLYDQVEQFSRRLLEEVPGCLKALLLLAYVTYAQNTRQAQHYIRLAENLDPDMIMAQELFGDAIASRPADPFWALLKKAPTVIGQPHAEPVMAAAAATNGVTNHAPDTTAYADTLVRWDSLDTIMQPQPEHQPVEDASTLLSWAGTGNGKAVWSSDTAQPTAPAEQIESESSWQHLISPEAASPEQSEDELGSISSLYDDVTPESNASPASQDIAAPSEAGKLWSSAPETEDEETWVAQSPAAEAGILSSSTPAAQAAPPAWLEMLTSSGWKQPTAYSEEDDVEIKPADQSYEEEIPVSPVPQEPPPFTQHAYTSLQAKEPDYSSASFYSIQDVPDDEVSFGPEWLRSLGASLIDEEQTSASEQTGSPAEFVQPDAFFAAEEELPASISPGPQASSTYEAPAGESAPSSTTTTFVNRAPEPGTPQSAIPGAESRATTPLEDWLSHAADQLSQPDQNVLTTLEALETDLRERGFVPLEPGTLSTITQEEEQVPFAPTTPAQPNRASTTTRPLEPVAQPAHAEEPAEPLWPAATPPTPTPAPAASTAQQDDLAAQPAMRMDQLLDVDLETTMKSPAIRLQPLGQRPASHSTSGVRSRAGERSAPHQASGGNLSNKERLLKGYQYQLAGDYDEAMQEYRIIIRNAPELVGEIISNVRALLKIAPKFGPGYRVLGDAYMRQGEYLQAMEAYNKALTMTRRTR